MPKAKKPYINRANADGFSCNTEKAFVILEIARADVETSNIASVLERLHVLTDSRENVLRYQHSLALAFAGYDDDPRHLPQIPEVREFMARLNKDWPHWLWYSARFGGTIPLLLSLLCDVNIVDYGTGQQFGTEFTDMSQIAAVVGDMFERGNALFHAFGITEKQATKSAESALNTLGL